MSNYIIPLGTTVVTRLSQLGRTRGWLATEMGVRRAVLRRMMNVDAKLSEVECMAKILGVSSQWLLRPSEEVSDV